MASKKTYTDPALGQVTIRKNGLAKRMIIRVTARNGVAVTIPSWMPFKAGELFLATKRDWAMRALVKVVERTRENTEPTPGSGGMSPGPKGMAPGSGGMESGHGGMAPGPKGMSPGPGGMSPDSGGMSPDSEGMSPDPSIMSPDSGVSTSGLAAVTPETIEQWRKTAKDTLPRRLEELARKYGFIYNRVTIKHNRSNWGSCSAKGNINLNLNIVRLPSDIQDYILLHELCHLRHMNHGREFHELLEELCRKEFGEGNVAEQVHLSKRKVLKQYRLY